MTSNDIRDLPLGGTLGDECQWVASVDDPHATGPGARLSRLATRDWLPLELEGADAGVR